MVFIFHSCIFPMHLSRRCGLSFRDMKWLRAFGNFTTFFFLFFFFTSSLIIRLIPSSPFWVYLLEGGGDWSSRQPGAIFPEHLTLLLEKKTNSGNFKFQFLDRHFFSLPLRQLPGPILIHSAYITYIITEIVLNNTRSSAPLNYILCTTRAV